MPVCLSGLCVCPRLPKLEKNLVIDIMLLFLGLNHVPKVLNKIALFLLALAQKLGNIYAFEIVKCIASNQLFGQYC